MSLKVRTPCLIILLLFLAVFGLGTAVAAEIGNPINPAPSLPVLEDPILQYQSFIYVSNGTNVTIVLNENISSDSPNFYSVDYYEIISPGSLTSNGRILYKNASIGDVIQFEVNAVGEYTVHICGYFFNTEYKNPVYSNNNNPGHRGQYITFKVVDLNENNNNDNPTDDSDPELLILPSQSYFTYTCGSSDHNLNYYISSYDHLFTDDLYPDLLNVLKENNVIYNFYSNNLQAVSWYSSDSDIVKLKGEKNIIVSDGVNIEISAYKPEFTVNMSKASEMNINYIFICPEHGDYTAKWHKSSITSDYDEYIHPTEQISDCKHEFEWQAFVEDMYKENSSDFFSYYEKPVDGDEETNPVGDGQGGNPEDEDKILYPHYVSFNNIRALYSDLAYRSAINLSFYPKIIQEEAVPNPSEETGETGELNEDYLKFDETLKTASIPFTFTREVRKFTINTANVENGNIKVSLKSNPDSTPEVPGLSNMFFPEIYGEILQDTELVIETLNAQSIEDVESELITEETPVHAVINIDFSNVNTKNALNSELEKNNGKVALEFEVPAFDSEGNLIQKEDLAIFHVIDSEDGRTLEKLNIDYVSSKNIDNGYYVVTAYTSGFSPFIIASDEFESAKSNSAVENSVIIPDEELIKNGVNVPSYSTDVDSPSTIAGIVGKVRGHMSIFSIFVVLTSGLFMWDYIRRRV